MIDNDSYVLHECGSLNICMKSICSGSERRYMCMVQCHEVTRELSYMYILPILFNLQETKDMKCITSSIIITPFSSHRPQQPLSSQET